MHGGATTANDRWHRPRLPKKGELGGVEKLERKLQAAEKRRAFRFQRLATMSPSQRERFLRWEASHAPGPASGRAHRRQQLATKKLLDELLTASDARRAEEQQRERALRTEVLRDRELHDDPAEVLPGAKAPIQNPPEKTETQPAHDKPLIVDVFA